MFVIGLPNSPSGDIAHVFAGTGRADDAIRPVPRHDKVLAVVEIGEVDDGLLERLWLLHGVPHSQKYARNELLSQVYYCASKTHDLISSGINTCRETHPRETSRSGFRTPVESIGLHVPEMSFRRKKSSFAALTKSTPLLAHNKVANNFRRAASAASEFMRHRMETCELQNISSLECALAKKHQGGGVFCYRATSRAGKVAASLGRSVKSSRMRTWGK